MVKAAGCNFAVGTRKNRFSAHGKAPFLLPRGPANLRREFVASFPSKVAALARLVTSKLGAPVYKATTAVLRSA